MPRAAMALATCLRFVHAFFRQVTLRVGWTFGVFTVDRDAVADDVQIHRVAPFEFY